MMAKQTNTHFHYIDKMLSVAINMIKLSNLFKALRQILMKTARLHAVIVIFMLIYDYWLRGEGMIGHKHVCQRKIKFLL